MNTDIIKGHWNEVKGKLKQKWGQLTDDQVTQMQGNYDELQGHIQKTYGYDKDQSKKEIDDFIKENKWENK